MRIPLLHVVDLQFSAIQLVMVNKICTSTARTMYSTCSIDPYIAFVEDLDSPNRIKSTLDVHTTDGMFPTMHR